MAAEHGYVLTFLFTAAAMISLLVCSKPSTACAAPLDTLNVDPSGALMVASVLCSYQPDGHRCAAAFSDAQS